MGFWRSKIHISKSPGQPPGQVVRGRIRSYLRQVVCHAVRRSSSDPCASGCLASSVEAVPPAAAQNRKNEVQKALEHKTKSDLVASNHFYFPLKFHDNFNIAAGNLQAAKDARLGKDRARYLVVVLLRLADVNSDMEGYIDFDLKRRPAILNDDARSTMRSRLQAARIQTTSLLQCIIDEL